MIVREEGEYLWEIYKGRCVVCDKKLFQGKFSSLLYRRILHYYYLLRLWILPTCLISKNILEDFLVPLLEIIHIVTWDNHCYL